MQFEVNIIVGLQTVASDGLTNFFKAMSWLGSYVGFVVMFIVMFFLSRRLAYVFGGCFFGGVVGNYILKHLIDRPRPFVNNPEILNLTNTLGESMPSSHAMCSIMIAIFLCYFVFKLTQKDWARIMAIIMSIILVVLTCLSRLYLGMHYLSDLVVGLVIGTIISFLGIYFYQKKGKNARVLFQKRK